jgi:hypothetical protein
MCSTTHQTN